MSNTGNFYIYIGMNNREADALALGMKMVSCILPHLGESASSLWEKLCFFPKELSARGESLQKISLSLSCAAEREAKLTP